MTKMGFLLYHGSLGCPLGAIRLTVRFLTWVARQPHWRGGGAGGLILYAIGIGSYVCRACVLLLLPTYKF